MGTIGPLAVVMGFSPFSSHVATAPITFHHHSSSEHHGPRTKSQGSWNTDHGPSNADRGPLSLKCVSIVAELRQNLGVARYRGCSFNAKKVSRWVSRFASKCRGFCQSVAGRLELFQYSPLKCDNMSTIATPRDSKTGIKRINATPRDTWGIAMFCLIKRLIPKVLRDRSSLFTIRDTIPEFLAQNNKKNIKYPSSCRDRILPYFRHNWGSINLLCKSSHF